MWQEARKQEKKLRGIMIDFKKRAERRQAYYAKMVPIFIMIIRAGFYSLCCYFLCQNIIKRDLMFYYFFREQILINLCVFMGKSVNCIF